MRSTRRMQLAVALGTLALSPGDFIYVPARHPHYGGARQETVIQLHGEGPFQLFLGSPK
ncbi:MAG: hypothetical protein M3Z18_11300 [Gemmatimonadota bacterium]|nr:hypothetical protein [Gemmatimonadota bacterium]